MNTRDPYRMLQRRAVCVCVCACRSQCATVCWHTERKGGMTVIYQGDGGSDGITNAKTCSTALSTSPECCKILHSFSRHNARLHPCQHPAHTDRQGANRVYTQTSAGEVIKYIWSTYVWSWDALTRSEGRWQRRCSRGKMMHSRPTLPVPSVDLASLPASRRGAEGFVCVSASLATVPLGCAGPPDAIAVRQRCAAGLHTPQWLLSPPSLPPSFATRRAKKPPLHPKCRLLTYLAVSSLIQKTSKQMRSSPVQRCRPAAHASCQETPHTCWLCTFPGKQKQTLDEGGRRKEEDKKMRPLTMRGIFSLN